MGYLWLHCHKMDRLNENTVFEKEIFARGNTRFSNWTLYLSLNTKHNPQKIQILGKS